MPWIILEGLDRTGKSTVADIYKKQGYEIVHMSAPDKKYKQPGYSGPLYLDDMLELYLKYDNKDVVFDRSIYGEFVWPHVYNREPNLQEEDLEVLQEFENRNSAQKLLMSDPDTDAHWKRCVENNEPLTRPQFTLASRLFSKLAHDHNFIPRQLSDFKKDLAKSENKSDNAIEDSGKTESIIKREVEPASVVVPSNNNTASSKEANKTKEQEILEKANAINSILSKRIVKQKGKIFDSIESDIKKYLNSQLKTLFNGGSSLTDPLTEDEVLVLKLYAKKILEKQKERV